MEAMDEIKRDLQRHFTDGLAIVVGSGLSCAEGLSGMGELAAHLDSVLPEWLDDDGKSTWATISHTVKEHGLEAALMKHEPSGIPVRQWTARDCLAGGACPRPGCSSQGQEGGCPSRSVEFRTEYSPLPG